ncbi:MAG TPA: DUF4783 domain-containing protein [Bacteroidia bacterium]|jgi:Domain of unknown function (DUF4783)|nr:DUF4783 domain-containing protein [Bacteroidia bacterium]HQF27337.1 DUF4783 domain-containing protein [Bacteroidia bacterium]HQK96586.1 DUF4783 domain-containing protein [Bacteroidia bacterium]
MKKYKLFILAIILSAAQSFAALDIFDDVANSLRSGDAKSISHFFGNTIDLTIIDQEEVYSKVQAEQILRDFFSKNTVRSFTLIHKGESKEGARYAIGSMVTAQGVTYRTYFYLKQQGGTSVIQELRFMRE